MEAEANAFRVEFPDFSCSVLQKLNQQRQLGQLCDITVVVQGRRFRAHRAVLAASSPYFCDQVLLKNSLRVTLPDVMPPAVFESLLLSCYTGALLLPAADVVAFLTAASFLQMWHVVDKCTELLEGNPAVLCQRSCPGSALPSPRSGAGDCADCEAEPPAEEGPRPLYVPPSIMCHRRWVQVKAEKPEPETGRTALLSAVWLSDRSVGRSRRGLERQEQVVGVTVGPEAVVQLQPLHTPDTPLDLASQRETDKTQSSSPPEVEAALRTGPQTEPLHCNRQKHIERSWRRNSSRRLGVDAGGLELREPLGGNGRHLIGGQSSGSPSRDSSPQGSGSGAGLSAGVSGSHFAKVAGAGRGSAVFVRLLPGGSRCGPAHLCAQPTSVLSCQTPAPIASIGAAKTTARGVGFFSEKTPPRSGFLLTRCQKISSEQFSSWLGRSGRPERAAVTCPPRWSLLLALSAVRAPGNEMPLSAQVPGSAGASFISSGECVASGGGTVGMARGAGVEMRQRRRVWRWKTQGGVAPSSSSAAPPKTASSSSATFSERQGASKAGVAGGWQGGGFASGTERLRALYLRERSRPVRLSKRKTIREPLREMDDGSSFIEFDVPEFSSTVLSQLNELRLQGKLCDIIVHIQGQPFRAHKAVLAASSPYFRDHSALSTMSGLSISVIKSPDVFEQLLSFCYTGRMSLQLKDVISFLTAASFLQMQAVIDKCTQILEGIHSKISLPGPADAALGAREGLRARSNGVKDGHLFVNPLEISPPCFPRGGGGGGFEGDLQERSLQGQWYPYNERLICIYCGKSFNQKGSLDRHMRLHMGITPFVCKFCGKKYTRKDQLEYHIRGHTDNKPFRCEICGKCFPFQGTLNQHLRKKHMGLADARNHLESPERTEGAAEQRDPDEPLAADFGAPGGGGEDQEEADRCSPAEAQASRCDF
nr:PREDICTED: uncharacterized protein LOC102689637 [Lepisosteus oculatus]